MAIARQIARRLRLGRWRVEAVVEDGTEVELVPPGRVRAARAWDLTYALRDQPEVVYAEPMFRYFVPENAPVIAHKKSGAGSTDDPATDTEYDWSLRKTNVFEAWRLFGPRPPGAGVYVGHPDTGYTLHPELADPARLLVSAGYDYDDNDPDPVDDLNDGFLDNPSHGTGTGSVILSGVGAADGRPGPFVSGAAPNALLIPIRTTESVVLVSMRGLRQAIDHAATHGAQVVSISLGGPLPGLGTRRAIQRAIDGGAIVLAAAGNEVGFVVFPAAFDEVVAVAACNIRDQPWSGSSHGDAVDITAPGESVWRARTVLVRKYGAANIARVFKQQMQATCRTPRGWDTRQYGPGIVDATKLLATALPDAMPARKLRDAGRAAVSTDTTGLEMLVHVLPDVPRTRIEEMLAVLLEVSDRDLPSVLQRYGDELAFQLVMHPAVLQTFRQTSRGSRAARSSRMTVRRRLVQSELSSRLRKRLREGSAHEH